MGNCYSYNLTPLNWNDAAEYCRQQDASLASIDSVDDQTFYAGYVQGILSGVQQTNDINGIWTAVRAVMNVTRPVWVSFPGSYQVDQTFWASLEPNVYLNYNEICVALEPQTMYREWVTSLCSDSKYVVCKKKVEQNDNDYVAQCSCPQGYAGLNCEIADESSRTTTTCSGNSFQFACNNGQTIIVDYASYGAVENYTCNSQLTTKQTCSNPNSLQTIINSCQGLTFCQIQNLSSLFVDTPCPVPQELNLQTRMRCTNESQVSCSSGAFYYSGRCYSPNFDSNSKKQKTFAEAVAECRSSGGSLLSSIDQQLFDQLTIQLRRNAKKSKNVAVYWIDLSLSGQSLEWADGSKPDYMPENDLRQSSTDCAMLMINSTLAVYTQQNCKNRANFICQSVPSSPNLPQHVQQEAPPPPEDRKIVYEGSSKPNVSPTLLDKPRFCKSETIQGVKYNKTRACMQDVQPCPDPDNVVGTVYRYCNCQTAKWDAADTTNCTHKWVGEIRNAVGRGDPAETISESMSKNLQVTIARQLYGGDITGSVQLSSQMLDLARSQFDTMMDRNNRQDRATNFTQNLGSSGDQLLSSKAVPVWDQLHADTRISHASSLMSVLEQSAILLGDYLVEPNAKYQYHNWAMEVEVRPPEVTPHARVASFGMQIPQDDSGVQSADFSDSESASSSPSLGAATPTIVQFDIQKSPSMTLPSFGILRSSATVNTRPATVFTSQSFAHPGDSDSSQSFAPAAAPASLDRSSLKLGYYAFSNFGSLLSRSDYTIVNSNIIGAAVDNATKSIQLPANEPVTFTFYHLQTTGVANPRCVYWDLQQQSWNTTGCTLLSTSAVSSQCACTHLTSFAILMDVSGQVGRFSGNLASALDVISTIGCAISVVCLAMSLFVFTFFRNLYNVRNSIHRNLCLCLLIAELVFVIGMDRTSNRTGCGVVAILLHYFFLASFCWMLLEGYQLYMMLIQVFEPNRTRIVLYYVFCYGAPAIIVAVAAGVKWEDYGTNRYCWINTSTPTLWAFIGPVLAVIAINILFLLIALKVVLSVNSRDRSKWDRIIGWLKGSATLLCLLGITWLFGFLTAVKGGTGTVFAWIFTILNCTQGVFIFFLHVVLNEKVRSSVVRWLRSGICCLPDTSSAYNSRSFASSRQRILNMMKTNNGHSVPSTASTDDKEKQMTPISKTNDWLRRMPMEPQDSLSHDDVGISIDDVTQRRTSEERGYDLERSRSIVDRPNINNNNFERTDRVSFQSDPRGSEIMDTTHMEKKAPVKRKKFPLGVSASERGSQHRNRSPIVHRF